MAKHTSQTAESFVNDSTKRDPAMNEETPSGATTAPRNNIPKDVPEGWVEEQTGFPPYWSPDEKGAFFIGIPLMKDEGFREGDAENPSDFVRYAIRATQPVECWKGKSESAEGVTVQPGEFFTCSAYASMRLERYFGYEVMVKAVEKVPHKAGRMLWKFRVFVAPETRKQLDAERSDRAKRLLAERNPAPF